MSKIKKSNPINVQMFLLWTILLISFVYQDFSATQRHGIEVWNCLVDGNIFSFYKYCDGIGNGVFYGNSLVNGYCKAVYDFPIYIIFAIWNFPCWIYEKVTGGNAQELWIFICWGKLMIAFFCALSASYVKRIWQIGNKSKSDEVFNADNVKVSFGISVVLLYYSIICGCCDIISISFTLMGIYYYLKDDKKRFLLAFALGVSMKFWALICFIPLILYKTKNIFKICLELASGCLIMVGSKLLFAINNSLIGIGTEGSLDLIFSGSINIGLSSRISLFIVVYFGVCVYSYFRKWSESYYFETIKICFYAYLSVVVFNDIRPYWGVIFIPFLILYVWNDRELLKRNLIWESLFQTFWLLYFQMRFRWVPDGASVIKMMPFHLLQKFGLIKDPTFKGCSIGYILNIIQKKIDIESILFTLAICSIMILILESNRVLRNVGLQDDWIQEKNLLKVRTVWFVLLAFLPVLLWVVQTIIYAFYDVNIEAVKTMLSVY